MPGGDDAGNLRRAVLGMDRRTLDAQEVHWGQVFAGNPSMFGEEPSVAARWAADLFKQEEAQHLLELGSGQGRDTIFFAREGFSIDALDYCQNGVEALNRRLVALDAPGASRASRHDVREPLPFDDGTFDACFSHMLFCMALSTAELALLSHEVLRVLRPGGVHVYTVRNTDDPHYGTGIPRGEDLYEIAGGFIVHFFDRKKMDRLAEGYEIVDITEFEEGDLPKRLSRVAMRKPRSAIQEAAIGASKMTQNGAR